MRHIGGDDPKLLGGYIPPSPPPGFAPMHRHHVPVQDPMLKYIQRLVCAMPNSIVKLSSALRTEDTAGPGRAA